MAPFKGDDGTASGFITHQPFGLWGDAGSTGTGLAVGNGVIGSSKAGSGVAGFSGHVGAFTADPNAGVYGSSVEGIGVAGDSTNSIGVQGVSDSGAGVSGDSTFDTGGIFTSGSGVGLRAYGGPGSTGVSATGVPAGEFLGPVNVTGYLTVGGPIIKPGGGFTIDHPLDPANQYLSHSFVESPDMKNLYDGIAVCGANGETTVELPPWFEVLNGDFRYQLTPIGAPRSNLFIADEIRDRCFRIGGGAPGLKVSWQVTGVRHDAWAKANRIITEEPKPANERGQYLHPEVHGQPPERGIDHPRLAEARQALERLKKNQS